MPGLLVTAVYIATVISLGRYEAAGLIAETANQLPAEPGFNRSAPG